MLDRAAILRTVDQLAHGYYERGQGKTELDVQVLFGRILLGTMEREILCIVRSMHEKDHILRMICERGDEIDFRLQGISSYVYMLTHAYVLPNKSYRLAFMSIHSARMHKSARNYASYYHFDHYEVIEEQLRREKENDLEDFRAENIDIDAATRPVPKAIPMRRKDAVVSFRI